MEEFLVFIKEQSIWIYLSLGLAGLIYLRLTINRLQEYRRAFFNIEREQAREELVRAAIMSGLTLAGIAATFLISYLKIPMLPILINPTAVPTVSLLTPMSESEIGAATPMANVTPISNDEFDNIGCQNPDATILFPEDGSSISGVIEVRGTANISNFAFYKFEFMPVTPGAVWRAVSAGTGPIVEATLGTWDTSLVDPGEYAFRLVVTDTEGNAPFPCVIRIKVLPSE